jgi:hypothetical protein
MNGIMALLISFLYGNGISIWVGYLCCAAIGSLKGPTSYLPGERRYVSNECGANSKELWAFSPLKYF